MGKPRQTIVRAQHLHDSNAPLAKVTRTPTAVQFELPLDKLERPPHSIAIHCATTMLRHGEPEVHFGVLNHDDSVLVRTVVARFDRNRFIERIDDKSDFRDKLNALLEAQGRPEPPGFFSQLYEKADKSSPQTLILDVEAEMLSYVGMAAAVILITANNVDISLAIQNKAGDFIIRADIEITMRTVVLADLLNSWESLAQRLRSTR